MTANTFQFSPLSPFKLSFAFFIPDDRLTRVLPTLESKVLAKAVQSRDANLLALSKGRGRFDGVPVFLLEWIGSLLQAFLAL